MKKMCLFATMLMLLFPTLSLGADNLVQNSKTWVELGELTASDGFGYSVAMSGNTIVVGAPEDIDGVPSEPGAAYVFVEPGAGTSETAKLTASDGQAHDEFGFSVAIMGNTIVVGAPQANGYQGAVYLFVKPKDGWKDMTETAKLTASDVTNSAQLGYAVAISNYTVVAGAPYKLVSGYKKTTGEAYVFVKPDGGWVNMTETETFLPPVGLGNGNFFGSSVAIGGTTVVVGAPLTKSGGAWIFDINNGALGKLFVNGAAYYYLGFSVAITPDANVIAVSAPLQSVGGVQYSGAVYVFTKPPTGWTTTSHYRAELTATDPSQPPQAGGLGYFLALTSNGDAVIAGGANRNDLEVEYVFAKGGASWKSMTQTYEIAEAQSNELVAVAVSGNTICAGDPGALINGNTYQGAAFVLQFK